MPLKVPISTLRVFEAAARWQSFHAAASELNLTASAVSHSIRKMEEALGVVLFERIGRGVSLSSEGQTLMGYTERGFDELQRGLEAVSLVRPGCCGSTAGRASQPNGWRRDLRAFLFNAPTWKCVCRQVSNTRVSIRASSTPTSCTVCRGRKVSWCCRSRRRRSRRYARRTLRRRSKSPTDLLRHPLIQSDNKQVRWPAWFALNGIAVPSTSRGLRFDRSFLAIAVAADGLGIALESTLLAEREISRGRLVAPLSGRSQDIRYVGHHLVYPPPFERRVQLRLFAQWLARELDIELTPFM